MGVERTILVILSRAEKPLAFRDVQLRLKEQGIASDADTVEMAVRALVAGRLAEWGRTRRVPVVEITRAGQVVVEREAL